MPSGHTWSHRVVEILDFYYTMTRQRQGGGGGDHDHHDMGLDDYDNPDQHNTCRSTSCSSSSRKRRKMTADHHEVVPPSPLPSPSQDTPFFFDSLTPGSLPWMITVSGKGNRSELRPLLSDYYRKSGVRSRQPLLSKGSEESGSVLLQEIALESTLSGEGNGVLSDQFVTNTREDHPMSKEGLERATADVSKRMSKRMSEGLSEGVLSEEDVTSGMSESSALSHHHRILSDLRETPSCRASLGSCEGRRNCPRLLWVIQRSAILSTFPGV